MRSSSGKIPDISGAVFEANGTAPSSVSPVYTQHNTTQHNTKESVFTACMLELVLSELYPMAMTGCRNAQSPDLVSALHRCLMQHTDTGKVLDNGME